MILSDRYVNTFVFMALKGTTHGTRVKFMPIDTIKAQK